MQYFYTPHIAEGQAILEAEEAAHCVQVLRKRIGDVIYLVDGRGHWYEGILAEANKKKCLVSIRHWREEVLPHPAKIHIAIAPTKNIHRFEWFLEKATEIGIHRIIPILCRRSERKKIRPDRLQKIIIAAMKQSLKATLPILDDLQPFDKYLDSMYASAKNKLHFIAHCSHDRRQALHKSYQKGKDVVVLIGPEGDFHPDEIKKASEMGFVGISLGASRLRTETAGIVACHTLNLLNEKE